MEQGSKKGRNQVEKHLSMMSAVEIIAVVYQMNKDDVWTSATQQDFLTVELFKSRRHYVQRDNNIYIFFFISAK